MRSLGRLSVLGILLLSSVSFAARGSAASSLPGLGNVDPACGHGHGLQLRVPRGVIGDLTLAGDGPSHTLLGFDSGSPNGGLPSEPFTIYAIGPHCRIERGFGAHGLVRPHLPLGEPSSDISGIYPLRGGGFIVTASDRRSWWLGRFEPDGAVDRTFGADGWIPLLPPGGSAQYFPSVGDVVELPDGDLLVAGDDARPHADVQAYVMAVTASGQPDTAFGADGAAAVFPSATYGGGLLLQPDGLVIAIGSLGGAGCYTTLAEWLTPQGHPVGWIDANYRRATSPQPTEGRCAFGAAYLRPEGAMGIVQETFLEGVHGLSHFSGSILGFQPDGQADPAFGADGVVRFSPPVRMSFRYGVATLPDGDMVVESFGNNADELDLQDFTSSGQDLGAFGHDGSVRIHLPGGNVSAEVQVTGVVAGPPGDVDYALSSGSHVTVVARRA